MLILYSYTAALTTLGQSFAGRFKLLAIFIDLVIISCPALSSPLFSLQVQGRVCSINMPQELAYYLYHNSLRYRSVALLLLEQRTTTLRLYFVLIYITKLRITLISSNSVLLQRLMQYIFLLYKHFNTSIYYLLERPSSILKRSYTTQQYSYRALSLCCLEITYFAQVVAQYRHLAHFILLICTFCARAISA